jgi:alkanesulfonate monooxygenase SsuD/methylene tetrahydromethanopterin reductase-like flavin-dependent oxidoreductase (luciferase family)
MGRATQEHGLGLCLGPAWGASVADLVAAARVAEERGFARITTGEFRSDPFVWLAVLAAATHRVRLGTTIASISTRHPMIAAEAVASLQDVYGPRFEPGFGVSHQALNDELGAVQFGLSDLVDYVRCFRAVLTGRSAEHGRFRVPATGRERTDVAPVPVLIAALGLRAVGAGAEHADGLILTWTPLGRIREARSLVERGDDVDGRGDGRPVVRVVLPTFLDDDEHAARLACSVALHGYLQLPAYRRMLVESIGDEERVVAAATGRPQDVHVTLGIAVLDEVAAVGPADRVRWAVEQQLAAGADDVVLYPLDSGAGWRSALRSVLNVA